MYFLLLFLYFFRHFAQIVFRFCTNSTTKKGKAHALPFLLSAAASTEYVPIVIVAAKPVNDDDSNNNPDPGINSVVVITVAA